MARAGQGQSPGVRKRNVCWIVRPMLGSGVMSSPRYGSDNCHPKGRPLSGSASRNSFNSRPACKAAINPDQFDSLAISITPSRLRSRNTDCLSTGSIGCPILTGPSRTRRRPLACRPRAHAMLVGNPGRLLTRASASRKCGRLRSQPLGAGGYYMGGDKCTLIDGTLPIRTSRCKFGCADTQSSETRGPLPARGGHGAWLGQLKPIEILSVSCRRR